MGLAPATGVAPSWTEPLETIGVAWRAISRVDFPQPRIMHDLSRRAMAAAGGNGISARDQFFYRFEGERRRIPGRPRSLI